MKYWLVTTEMYPFSGGIGVYAHHSARMLAAADVHVTVVFHDPSAEPSVGRRDGYRLIRFSDRALCGRALERPALEGPLASAFATCEFLKQMMADEGAPDFVEFQDYGALGYFFLKHRLLEMGSEAPRVVLTAHRPYVHCAATDDESLFDHRTVFLGDAERWCYAAADAVLAPCRFIVDALKRPGLDFQIRDEDVHIVRNPFDSDVVPSSPADDLASPQRLELERRRFTPEEPILYFGKLQNQKGCWDLVAALSALAGEGRPQPLWMWGRDAFHSPSATTTYDFLEQRYRPLFRRGVVRYFGAYGAGTLRALCDLHPICLRPYREECLPYAFIEIVVAGGLPLTAPGGGHLELIPDALRDILIIDLARPDVLGDQLARAKALPPAERAQISATLRAEVARQTAYPAVLAQKLAALERVSLTSTADAYPFVHAQARTFPAMEAQARARLAASVPQRGATVRTRMTCAAAPADAATLVSVVIPFRDMADYIDDTIAAVEAQFHDNIEVVIVDDGSTSDAAKTKLEAILTAPRRFPTTVIRKYNGGLSDARNAGAKTARGGYLYFLDADDTIHPAMLSTGLAVLERFANVAYVGAWLREFGESDREWVVWDIDSAYIAFHNLQICGIS